MEQSPAVVNDSGEPQRCVAVIDCGLAVGKAANAAAVMALTLGARHPGLVGDALVDATGMELPGLIPIGIPVLGAQKDELPRIRHKGIEAGVEVIAFPVQGQQTNDYAEFRRTLKEVETHRIEYLGIMLLGPKKKISRIVGKYSLLRQP
jgi:hypothetical protein